MGPQKSFSSKGKKRRKRGENGGREKENYIIWAGGGIHVISDKDLSNKGDRGDDSSFSFMTELNRTEEKGISGESTETDRLWIQRNTKYAVSRLRFPFPLLITYLLKYTLYLQQWFNWTKRGIGIWHEEAGMPPVIPFCLKKYQRNTRVGRVRVKVTEVSIQRLKNKSINIQWITSHSHK